MALTNEQTFQLLYFLKWRYNGHTYTGDDTYAFAMDICKKENVNLFKSEIDLETQNLYIYGSRNGEKFKKTISLNEFKGYVSPYVKRDVYLTYKNREYLRQELDLFSRMYLKNYYPEVDMYYDTFRISHKTNELLIKYGTGFFKKTVRVSLDAVEDLLVKLINFKQFN